jgi:hypothetical protein
MHIATSPRSSSPRIVETQLGKARKVYVPAAVLGKLPISDSTNAILKGTYKRFPRLIIDECLADASSEVTEAVVSSFMSSTVMPTEAITLPKRRYGTRPIVITMPQTRILYEALVGVFAPALEETQSRHDWPGHENFGIPTNTEDQNHYVVDFDIASCYEYIDHELLQNELISRTDDVTHAGYLIGLLGEIYPKGRGLPQLSAPSDVLADAYLAIIERDLLRAGFGVSRFVDDFKVIAPSWEVANGVIEMAAESARALGLILSTEKTNVRRADTLAEKNAKSVSHVEVEVVGAPRVAGGAGGTLSRAWSIRCRCGWCRMSCGRSSCR